MIHALTLTRTCTCTHTRTRLSIPTARKNKGLQGNRMAEIQALNTTGGLMLRLTETNDRPGQLFIVINGCSGSIQFLKGDNCHPSGEKGVT